jgi:ABC-type glycerol-3-phosphate transport system substrate-binding protein
MCRKFSVKLLALVTAVALLVCMVGCGDTDTESTPNTSDEVLGEVFVPDGSTSDPSIDNSSNNTSNATPTIDMSKLEGKTVQMLLWREPNVSEKNVIKNFQNSTGIKVKYSVVNQSEYANKLAASIASNSGLDICAIQSGGMSILSKDSYASTYPVGTLQTMQPFFEVTGQDPNEGVWAKSWMDSYKIKDKYYGVAIAGGWHTLSTVIYYNVDLFEENGITTPRELWKAGKWNWDTFKEVALGISDIDDYYYGYAGRDSYAYMLSAGCDYVGFDGMKFKNTSTDAKLKKAWEFSIDMIESGAQFRTDGNSNFPQLFLEGKFGMYGEGSYCMANIGMLGDYAYNIDDVDFEIDAVPFPSPAGQEPVVINRANLFGIAKNSINPVAAGVFLRFWLDPKNAPAFSKTAINNNMRDVFEWINNESTPKKALLSGGILGYQDIEKLAGLTYKLMINPAEQINSTISAYQSFINNSVTAANKAIS